MATRVAVLGAGGHGAVVVSTAQAAGLEIVGVFDDREQHHGGAVLGVPIVGLISASADSDAGGVVIAIGDNATRANVARRLTLAAMTIVHPSANLSRTSHVGDGTVVFAAATVQPRTTIGEHVILNTGSVVDHDCRIGDFAHIGPGATICGDVVVGDGAFIGAGSTIAPGISIGGGAIVGAGAAVLDPVPAGTTVVGVPSRPIGDR